MAKPNQQQGRYDQKKAEPTQDQAQEQEEDVSKDANESEQKQSHEQNTLGNAAIQNQMIGSGTPSPNGEGGGGGLSMRKAGNESDRDYGGEDDAADDVPLTLEDLTRSWNPGTPKSKDRPSWLEPMPSDELPPEDLEFLEACRTADRLTIPRGFTLDSQLQPSTQVVAASLMDWGRAIRPFAGQDLLSRTMAHMFVPGASFLHDPDGRVLLHRVRAGAIGTLLLQASPLIREANTATIAFTTFCLELQGHRRHAEMVRIDPGVEGKQMPKTTTVLERSFAHRPGTVDPRDLPENARARLLPVLDLLLDLEDPGVYLPSMIVNVPEEEEDEDPLGLDAILAQFTGGKPDDDAPLYYAAMQAAERLAAATARTRIHVAAACTSLAQVSRLWSAGPPMDTLQHVGQTVDQETDRNLRLLVEVARAAKRKSVPPKGLKAGLTRAVRGLRAVHDLARNLLVETAGGILPGIPELPEALPPVQDPLASAWADGSPHHALPWLSGLPDTPEHDVSRLLIELTAGRSIEALGPALEEAAATVPDPLLAEAARVFAGSALLLGGHAERARILADRQLDVALQRRNGMLLAASALLGVEALYRLDRGEDAEALRLHAGKQAWGIGAAGALSALSRYTRPAED